jgi:Putative auto-transporter adhesin, head GIN domain
MKNFAKYLIFAALLTNSGFVLGQEIQKKLSPFSKITVSPKINLILQKGSEESIRIIYSNIDRGKINVEVEGNKLNIYLDQARIVDKRERNDDEYDYNSKTSIYHNAEVTAYVTYTQLKSLEVRGEQEVISKGLLENESFDLKAYGEAEITFDSLITQEFKAVVYGENTIKIKAGKAVHQRYRLYGENKIDTRALASTSVSTSIYGEGRLSINASDEVKVSAIGEPEVNVTGTSFINKGIIIGKADIRTHN